MVSDVPVDESGRDARVDEGVATNGRVEGLDETPVRKISPSASASPLSELASDVPYRSR